MVGQGPWLQDNLVIPGFDPTAIDGIAILAPNPSCGQGAGAGIRTLKVFNPVTNAHEVYKYPGMTMSFSGDTEDCTASTNPWCGGSTTFIHELIRKYTSNPPLRVIYGSIPTDCL